MTLHSAQLPFVTLAVALIGCLGGNEPFPKVKGNTKHLHALVIAVDLDACNFGRPLYSRALCGFGWL